ncbi:MAG: extracellular solute-binding protein [Rhodothermales bacterium]|nr:extracellular solute-binding protein [Rhodothermales bacterium]
MKCNSNPWQRRQLLKVVGAAAASSLLTPAFYIQNSRADEKRLRILRWKNFIPEFETWFNDVFVKEWGEKNGIDVLVDNVGLGEIDNLAAAEAQAGQGHDMVLFVSPRPLLEDHVIDHREVFDECERRFGKVHDFIHRSCYNPATNRYHGFCESYIPVMLTYRRDLWDAVGVQPATWDSIREGGRAIKLLHDSTVGFSLAPEHNGEQTLRALMSCFGASVQDENGNVSLRIKETIEALEFVRSLYQECMAPDVLTWSPPSNNVFMLSGNGCLTVDTISIIRAAQTQQFPVNQHLSLQALPEGPAGGSGPVFGANIYVIWRFARNPEAAKKFLIDYMAEISTGIQSSGFQNLPSYPNSVPDFKNMINSDDGPQGRYTILNDITSTQTNLGYPGYSNAAIDEVLRKNIITTMFSQVATGRLSPEDSVLQATSVIKPIFDKWKAAGKI